MSKVITLVVAAAILMSLAVAAGAQGLTNVELHGYAQNRFYANPDSSARFAVERVSLSGVGKLGTDGTGYLEVYFHPWLPNVLAAEPSRTYVESAYVDLPFATGRARVGKGRQLNFGMTPSYPNRKTTQYGILAETFTQDRIVGAQLNFKRDIYDAGLSVYSDYSVGTRNIGEYPGVPASQVVQHFVDKDEPHDISGELAVSARTGFASGCFQAHISGAVGKLRQVDADTINTAFGLPLTTDRDHNKYGIDAVYAAGPFVLQGEAYQGNWSDVKISGYSVLAGYQPKDSRRFYARWAALNYDQSVVPGTTTTYPTQQLTFGIVQPIRKGVWVEFQYERNMETTGGASDIDNDLLFVELFTGF